MVLGSVSYRDRVSGVHSCLKLLNFNSLVIDSAADTGALEYHVH